METLLHKPVIQNFKVNQTVGRPLFNGKNPDAVLSKLEYAFAIGCTVKEACSLALISTAAYYRFLDSHPVFRERFELFKTVTIFNARKAIANELARGNYKLAMWFMERKRPNEFSTNWVLRDMIDRLEEENKQLKEEIGLLLSKKGFK